MGYRTWVYHETEEPKVIDNDEVESYHADGWRDSPAPFLDVKDFGIDPDDLEACQIMGDTVHGIAESLNGALNIEVMERYELEEWASEHFNVDINPTNRRQLKTLRKECFKLVKGKAH